MQQLARRLGLTLAATVGIILGFTPGAQAYSSTNLYFYDNFVAYGGTDDYANTVVFVCDGRSDGYAAYIAYTAGGVGGRLYDPDGYGGNCGFRTPGGTVSKYTICLDIDWGNDPCTSIKYP
ncbi:hypothetical protein ABZS86_36235 [Streptomyces sp. NPDC005355]|uniref:hypothetical protein n=1 Tax=Streptomyces sp. NPDC005355 TaxID=3157038 RepID=UPI00339EA26D